VQAFIDTTHQKTSLARGFVFIADTTKNFSPLPLRLIKLIPYLCSPMKYLNKPSEKIIATESMGSTKLNFLLFHIDGRVVDRLFLFKSNN